jgi:hypothetical protein
MSFYTGIHVVNWYITADENELQWFGSNTEESPIAAGRRILVPLTPVAKKIARGRPAESYFL